MLKATVVPTPQLILTVCTGSVLCAHIIKRPCPSLSGILTGLGSPAPSVVTRILPPPLRFSTEQQPRLLSSEIRIVLIWRVVTTTSNLILMSFTTMRLLTLSSITAQTLKFMFSQELIDEISPLPPSGPLWLRIQLLHSEPPRKFQSMMELSSWWKWWPATAFFKLDKANLAIGWLAVNTIGSINLSLVTLSPNTSPLLLSFGLQAVAAFSLVLDRSSCLWLEF